MLYRNKQHHHFSEHSYSVHDQCTGNSGPTVTSTHRISAQASVNCSHINENHTKRMNASNDTSNDAVNQAAQLAAQIKKRELITSHAKIPIKPPGKRQTKGIMTTPTKQYVAGSREVSPPTGRVELKKSEAKKGASTSLDDKPPAALALGKAVLRLAPSRPAPAPSGMLPAPSTAAPTKPAESATSEPAKQKFYTSRSTPPVKPAKPASNGSSSTIPVPLIVPVKVKPGPARTASAAPVKLEKATNKNVQAEPSKKQLAAKPEETNCLAMMLTSEQPIHLRPAKAIGTPPTKPKPKKGIPPTKPKPAKKVLPEETQHTKQSLDKLAEATATKQTSVPNPKELTNPTKPVLKPVTLKAENCSKPKKPVQPMLPTNRAFKMENAKMLNYLITIPVTSLEPMDNPMYDGKDIKPLTQLHNPVYDAKETFIAQAQPKRKVLNKPLKACYEDDSQVYDLPGISEQEKTKIIHEYNSADNPTPQNKVTHEYDSAENLTLLKMKVVHEYDSADKPRLQNKISNKRTTCHSTDTSAHVPSNKHEYDTIPNKPQGSLPSLPSVTLGLHTNNMSDRNSHPYDIPNTPGREESPQSTGRSSINTREKPKRAKEPILPQGKIDQQTAIQTKSFNKPQHHDANLQTPGEETKTFIDKPLNKNIHRTVKDPQNGPAKSPPNHVYATLEPPKKTAIQTKKLLHHDAAAQHPTTQEEAEFFSNKLLLKTIHKTVKDPPAKAPPNHIYATLEPPEEVIQDIEQRLHPQQVVSHTQNHTYAILEPPSSTESTQLMGDVPNPPTTSNYSKDINVSEHYEVCVSFQNKMKDGASSGVTNGIPHEYLEPCTTKPAKLGER